MEIEEIIDNPAFYILTGIGLVAFIIMLMVLKGMGNANIMPWWVKIIVFLAIPIGAAAFSGWARGD